MAKDKKVSKTPKKSLSYYYNPFYKNNNELQFLEVWQVLEDDVLGSLYPWQYVATAENSNRIVTLNFLALKNFENDYRKYYDQMFVYKVSPKLLSEGNVHRLGSILQPNLILCFDIYQLEKFGDRAAIAGLNFLANIGATIMIEGVDKAPVDILLKYPTTYFLLDYRYYSNQNKGLIAMMKGIASQNNITIVVGNVNNKANLDIFKSNGIDVFAGSALVRPKRKPDSFIVDATTIEQSEKKSFIVSNLDAPKVKDRKVKEDKEDEAVVIDVTSQKEELKVRLAASVLARRKEMEEEKKRKLAEEARIRKEQEEKERELQKQKIEEANRLAKTLRAGQLTTSMEEFATLSKASNKNGQVKRGANVIKLNVSTPRKKK